MFTIIRSVHTKEIVDKNGALWYNLLRLYIFGRIADDSIL